MLPKGPYDAIKTEPEILEYWLKGSFFKPEYHPQKGLLTMEEMKYDGRDPYSIVNPPPNAYMRPHIGNVSGYAYQDVFLRFQRLLGKKVLGQPGKDHAGIQGEVVVEKIFYENKKKTKAEMGREKFYKAAYAHFEKLMPMIMADEKRIGLSSDYDRNLFTLDPRVVQTVLGTFISLFQDGMIYKGVRIVNWDPVAKTTLADIDTERIERESELIYLKYPLIRQKVWYLSFYNKKMLENILAGTKTIDTRALNPEEKERYFGEIKPGDLIVCTDKTAKEHIWHFCKVTKVETFKNIDEAYQKLDLKAVFGEDFKSAAELYKKYDSLAENYAYKINQNGLVATSLKNLEEEDFVQVATTRPETMLGDTAVIVNPKDKRYLDLVGKKVILPLANREIPVITSPRVEMEFGTGAVKLTPAHAYDDFVMMNEWNALHPNEQVGYINIIDKEAKLTGPVPSRYIGKRTDDARKQITEELEQMGLVAKKEKHSQAVMVGERSKAVIEQIMSSQWFIDVEKLKAPAIAIIKNGGIKIHPDYMKKKYLNWMENLHDWPVSRSLWWGYRIPVWYKGELSEKIDENGQIVETLGGVVIKNIHDAVKKGLARVQINPPGTELTILRHAETEFNHKGIWIGTTDVPLNETGRQKAEKYAGTITTKYDLIICSPLKRTRETADIIAKKHNIEVITDKNLQERYWGVLEGITYVQFAEKYPEAARKNTEDYQPDLPEAETIEQVEARVAKVIETIKAKYEGKRILIVTHAGIIRVFKRQLLGQTAAQSREDDPENLDHYEMAIAGPGWIQDNDVLDTWFSSGQWPYATLQTNELMDTFYPTDVMETAYDILELWVSRMIMLGLYTQKQIPFKHVYLHGLVRATDGQKMSKSKNNVINPDEIINKFGADALRLLYIVGNKAGAGYPVSFEKLEGNKRFLNKIWNAAKFVLGSLDEIEKVYKINPASLKFEKTDTEMLGHINKLAAETQTRIEKFNIGFAASEIYESFWHTFADIYLEGAKTRLYTKDKEGNIINMDRKAKESRQAAQYTLYTAFTKYLVMLHPFIPFITEKVWQELPKPASESGTIMYAQWPDSSSY